MNDKLHKDIAGVLAKHRMLIKTDEWCKLVDDFIGLFAKENPRFDSIEFRDRCWK